MVNIVAKFMDTFSQVQMDVETSVQQRHLYSSGTDQAKELHKCFKLSVLPKKDIEEVSVALGSVYYPKGGGWELEDRFHNSKPLLTQTFLRGQKHSIEFAGYKEYRWNSLQWGGPASTSQFQPNLQIGGVSTNYEKYDQLFVALDVFSKKCRWGKRAWVDVSRVKPGDSFDAKITSRRPRVLPKMSEEEKTSMMRVVFPMARAKKLLGWIVGGLVLLGAIAGWFNGCYDFVQKIVAIISKHCGG